MRYWDVDTKREQAITEQLEQRYAGHDLLDLAIFKAMIELRGGCTDDQAMVAAKNFLKRHDG